MTSYTPACSATQSPDELGVQLGYIIGNKLQFAGEQSKIIYDLCLKQVSACQLPARCIRIFNTILNQTIGYQKREDHATTTRLQELTKIRYDHIGEAIRFLSQANIIQWRQGGKYNNYLSVNFDFASWFQKDPAKRMTNNDPTILLPDHYKKPIDEGFGADFLVDDDSDYPMSKTFSQNDQTTEIKTEKIESTLENTTELSNLNYNSMDRKVLVQIIEEVLEQHEHKQLNTAKAPLFEPEKEEVLEQQNAKPCNTATITESFSQSEKTQSIEAKTVIEIIPESDIQPTADSIVNSEKYQQLQQKLEQQSEQFQQKINDLTETKNNQVNDLSQFKNNQAILEQQLTERHAYEQTQAATIKNNQQTIDDLEQKNQHLQAKGRDQHLKNSIHQAVSNGSNYTNNNSVSDQSLAQFANLNYPQQLTKEERLSVQKLVSKAGSREQDILDLLKIRLTNTVDPLNNRLSYFASLINRYRKGELDFSALESFQSPDDVEAKRAIHTGLDKLIDVYRECHCKRVYYREQLEDDYSQYNQDYYTEFNNKAHAVYDEICTYVETHQLNKKMIAGIKFW
jgi:phage replication O-like protein O